MMFLSIGEVAAALGVSRSSLRLWEKEGRFQAAYRTPGGHRRYSISQIENFTGSAHASARMAYAYARVSSNGQKDDLIRQKDRLRHYLNGKNKEFVLLEDLGSGLNCKKPGLTRLINDICQRKVSQLVLTHRDRLLRFGSELVFNLCRHFGTQVLLLDDEARELSFEEELSRDVIQIMTVFTAKVYGKRAQENRRPQAESLAA